MRLATAARLPATIRPIAGADGVSPIDASASAARPATSGDASASAARSGSTCVLSPRRPSANAAICRTSGSLSPFRTAARFGAASASPTRPAASAALRRTRASESVSRRSRSGGGGGGGGSRLLFPRPGGGGGGIGATASRRIRASSKRRTHDIFVSKGIVGTIAAAGGALAHPAAAAASNA